MAYKKIQGMDVVLRNLRREINNIKGRSTKGLIEASMLVRRDMEKTPPLLPVDTGNLRSSWFTIPFMRVDELGIFLGFSANYAFYVHEMMDNSGGKKINWNRPRSGPKFLESALKRNKEAILKTIGENAKID